MHSKSQHSQTPPIAGPQRSLLRAIGLRALAYTLLCAIVLLSLVDLSALRPPNINTVTNTLPPADAPSTSATPGWPHLRGPAYDAHAPDLHLPDTWPKNGPPILWNREIGAGYSALITHAGRAYTQTQSLTKQKVLCLDADTGRTLWEHDYAWPYQPGGMFPGPRATPTYAAGRIYFAAPDGHVACLDATTGQPLWSLNVLKKFDGRGADFGYACSPVVEDGLVILPVGGPTASVVALDADTGQTRWTSGSAPASYASALPITFQGRRQVVTFLQSALAAFDLPTGQLLWEHPYARGFDEHAATPLYREPHLRVMQAYRAGSDLYELRTALSLSQGRQSPSPRPNAPSPVGEGRGEGSSELPSTLPSPTAPTPTRAEKLRHDPTMSNDIASSVLVDDHVYGFDLREMQASNGRPSRGTFRCIDFLTGKIQWSSDRPGHSAIAYADGKLYLLNDSGQLLMIRATPDRYDELARTDVFPGETCWTAPALDAGRLLLRSPTRAACLYVGHPDAMTPRQQHAATTARPASPVARPTPSRPIWLVGADRDYPFEMPDRRELTRWYLYSLAPLTAAALLSYVILLISTKTRDSEIPQNRHPEGVSTTEGSRPGTRAAHPAALATFFTALILFAILTTPLANHRTPHFVFTWPLALLAIHQLALTAVSHPKHKPHHATWPPLAGVTLLVLTCLTYFKLTRQLNLAPAWYFLATLPATWPLAIPFARRLHHPTTPLPTHLLWMLTLFTTHFCTASAIMLLRTHLLERAS